MNIKAILAKVAAGDALTDAEKNELAGYDPDGASDITKRLKDAEAKAARILSEKKALADKVAEMESKLEELSTAGKPEIEQMKTMLAKATEKLQSVSGELDKERAEHAKTTREHLLDAIHAGIRFDRNVMPAEHSRVLLANALNAVQDLNDEGAVKAALDPFVAKSKAFILANTPGGAGTKAGEARHTAGTVVVDGAGLLKLATSGSIKDAEAAIDAAAKADTAGQLQMA